MGDESQVKNRSGQLVSWGAIDLSHPDPLSRRSPAFLPRLQEQSGGADCLMIISADSCKPPVAEFDSQQAGCIMGARC
jgi:hypothetical protein